MCDRISPGAVDCSPTTDISTSPALRTSYDSTGRDRQADLKRSKVQGNASERSVYLADLYGAKEEWIPLSSGESKTIESIYVTRYMKRDHLGFFISVKFFLYKWIALSV